MFTMIRGFLALAIAFPMFFAGAPSAFAQVDITCISALSRQTVQNVIVPQGAVCSLTDMTVLGNVEVKELATVTIRRGSVNGDVIAEAGATARLVAGRISGGVAGLGARLININGTSIAIDVTADQTTSVVVGNGARAGSIEILKGGSANISGGRLSGSLKFEENRGAITASSNIVAGNFEAFLNQGRLTFNSNTITGNMQCKENRLAPTGSGNTAAIKEDQCAAL